MKRSLKDGSLSQRAAMTGSIIARIVNLKVFMKHGSLFSGIGGFDLAAEWLGIENIFQVEIDPFCNQVLQKNFPNTQRYGDIRSFPASDYAGRIDVLTGGFPCQPFSSAGKQKGREDTRHLWPEMLRVISSIKPTWVIAENVRGLLSIESGLAFEQVCVDLENEGYEVQPFLIPACAVDAPHKRERIWFIAHCTNARIEDVQERKDKIFQADVANAECQGYQGEKHQKRSRSRYSRRTQWHKHWFEVATEFCSVDDGLSVELGEFKRSKAGHRNEQIKAYGNAIVPQVAYKIFQSIIYAERKSN